MVLAVSQFTIIDMNDILSSATAPENPTPDLLWLDTSQTPNLLKRWNGSDWVRMYFSSLEELDPTQNGKVNEAIALLTAIGDDTKITLQERTTLKARIASIVGTDLLETDIMPTVSSLENTIQNGEFYEVRQEAKAAGISTSHADMNSLLFYYDRLRNYLNAIVPKPWDTTSSVVTEGIDVVTWRTNWLLYENALAKLRTTIGFMRDAVQLAVHTNFGDANYDIFGTAPDAFSVPIRTTGIRKLQLRSLFNAYWMPLPRFQVPSGEITVAVDIKISGANYGEFILGVGSKSLSVANAHAYWTDEPYQYSIATNVTSSYDSRKSLGDGFYRYVKKITLPNNVYTATIGLKHGGYPIQGVVTTVEFGDIMINAGPTAAPNWKPHVSEQVGFVRGSRVDLRGTEVVSTDGTKRMGIGSDGTIEFIPTPLTSFSYLNGWASYNGSQTGYYKDYAQRVYLQGSVQSGSAGVTFGQLPVGFRPSADLHFVGWDANNTAVGIQVKSDGYVVVLSPYTTFVSLSQVSFRI